jgi:2-polyprenyl-6-methoxyphenol hydroxylase-like FAD-dependent oxidoreductase
MHELVDGVVVVGGGLSGLALSAILRGSGVPVEVLESRVDDPGAARGICLWSGALAALERTGLTPAITARGAPIERIQVWSAKGRPLLELSGEDAPVTGQAVRHDVLLELLTSACADVPINRGRHLIAYAEDARGVLLTCRGGWTLRAPVAVGADGARSTVRRQCFEDAPPDYSGDSVWEGVAPGPPALAPGAFHLFLGPYGVRATATAVDQTGTWAWWVDSAGERGEERDPSPIKPELRAMLDEMHGPVLDLIEATPEEAIIRTDVPARRKPGPPGKGRVTLMGDAWHPLPVAMRMGPSLALEDASALGEALYAEMNPIEALRAYERQRLARVQDAAKLVWSLRATEARFSPPATWLRDFTIRHLDSLYGDRLARLLAGQLLEPPPAPATAPQRPRWA